MNHFYKIYFENVIFFQNSSFIGANIDILEIQIFETYNAPLQGKVHQK